MLFIWFFIYTEREWKGDRQRYSRETYTQWLPCLDKALAVTVVVVPAVVVFSVVDLAVVDLAVVDLVVVVVVVVLSP